MAKKTPPDANGEYQIRCKVFPGQFSTEYAVECAQADGSKVSLFAPAKDVEPLESPTREHPVGGWLRVTLWEVKGGRAIVKLPRDSFESGRFVTVNLSEFKAPPQPAEAS
jgi:hypothetical protein